MPLSLRLRTLLPLAALLLAALPACSEKLFIVSTPAGATVEIDGVNVDTTPFEAEYPSGYFHRSRTVLGARLKYPMVARVSLAGYATKEIMLTQGPMEWISALKHANHGQYWLIKTTHVEVTLDSIAETFTGRVNARLAKANASPAPLSLEVLAEVAKPAVVQLKGLQKMGTGFFITNTGMRPTRTCLARKQRCSFCFRTASSWKER
jgi:serine protease Do